MRKRRLRLALLAVALFGVVAWLLWPTTDPAIRAAKANYARLQLGMSEAEMTTIMGNPPQASGRMFGEWLDDSKLYALDAKQGIPNAGPPKKLYNYRGWALESQESSPSFHVININALFDQDRLIYLWHNELQDNAAKRWVRLLCSRLSLRPSVLNVIVDEGHKATPPP